MVNRRESYESIREMRRMQIGDFDSTSMTWYIFLLISFVTTLIFVSLFWFIGKRARNQNFYYAFMAMLVLYEIGTGAFWSFLFFGSRLSQWLPAYRGASNLDSFYKFMDSNRETMIWVFLGSVILEFVALCWLALYLQARAQALQDSKNHPRETNV